MDVYPLKTVPESLDAMRARQFSEILTARHSPRVFSAVNIQGALS